MRRFLYDAVLILLLVLIGISISNKDVVIDSSDEIAQFDESISNQEIIEEKEKSASLHQIEENGASDIAKNASGVVKEFVQFSVTSFTSLFEMLIQS